MNWSQIKLNKKYKTWIRNSYVSTYSILEGGVRSGKTTTMILAFCKYLEKMDRDGLHIAAAESISLAKAILMEGGNALGIKGYFAEKAVEEQYKGKDALTISINGTKQRIIFVGHKKSNSWQSIRGLTATSFVITEASVAHSTFISEAIARTMSTPGHLRKGFLDLNPDVSTAKIYTQFIDAWIKKQNAGTSQIRVNFDTVSIFDNPAMTREQIERELSLEDPNTAWFKAMYLGERIASADTVYTVYPYNVISASEVPKPVDYLIVVDVGVSSSATTFVVIERDRKNNLYITKHYWHKNGKGTIDNVKLPEDYAEDLSKFYDECTTKYGFAPKKVFIDRDISFYRILKRVFARNEIPTGLIAYAVKDKIRERITTLSNLLYVGQIYYVEDLEYVDRALKNAVYDDAKLEKGKLERKDDTNLDENPIDTLDGIEYGVSYYAPRLYRQ